MAVTRTWKVYGTDGHRQRESFGKSVKWDWSNEKDGVRIFEAYNYDKTGTHDYSVIRITRNTWEECERELDGQISDGYFENSRVGKIIEITEGEKIIKVYRYYVIDNYFTSYTVKAIKETPSYYFLAPNTFIDGRKRSKLMKNEECIGILKRTRNAYVEFYSTEDMSKEFAIENILQYFKEQMTKRYYK